MNSSFVFIETDYLRDFNFVMQLGMKFDAVRSESIILHVSPFNSTKKRAGVALRGWVTDLFYFPPCHFNKDFL